MGTKIHKTIPPQIGRQKNEESCLGVAIRHDHLRDGGAEQDRPRLVTDVV